MEYPRNAYRYDFFAPGYVEIAIENYFDAENLLNEMIKKQQYDLKSEHELEKKRKEV